MIIAQLISDSCHKTRQDSHSNIRYCSTAAILGPYMLKFIEGDKLIEEFQGLLEGSAGANLAVAFWGRGAASKLEIKRALSTRIICNLESGACHPEEIKEIRKYANVEIRTHRELHAKVYCADRGAIVGSSNASANGLAIPASDAPGWREANVFTDDPELLLDIRQWFERMWEEAKTITDRDIKQAAELWRKRRSLAPIRRKAKSLIESVSADAELLDAAEIYCIAYCEGLDPGARRKWSKLSGCGTLSNAWAYQPNRPFRAGSWLISCNFTNEKRPRIDGYLRVADEVQSWPSERSGESNLYAAFPKSAIKIGLVPYHLSSSEKRRVLSRLKDRSRLEEIWTKADALIPLRDLIR
jgi:hypothetical protein